MQSNTVSDLIINFLSQEQYVAANSAGNINDNELYMVTGVDTPEYSGGLATVAVTGNYADLVNTPEAYTLPIATASTLGGVKVGAGLAINAGVLSARIGTGSNQIAAGDHTHLELIWGEIN